MLAVNPVNDSEIAKVKEKDRGLDDVAKAEPRRTQNLGQIAHRAADFRFDTAAESSCPLR